MARKLASVQKILDLKPIEGADKIEIAQVLGWQVVVSKSELHKIGDLVVYIEIDSKVPELPIFEFLKDRKYLVRTIKLRKQISQGLIIPMREIEKHFDINVDRLKEGDDLTNKLGIIKYDPQAEEEQRMLEKEIKNNNNRFHKYLMKYKWYRKIYKTLKPSTTQGFPKWISKTDETRIQVLIDEFKEIKNNNIKFDSTEKLDGQSVTYFIEKNKKLGIFSKYEFGVCSKNLRLKSQTNSSYWTISNKYKMEEILKDLSKKFKASKVVLQGEIIGEKIQGNKYKIDDYQFYAFNLIIDSKKYRTCDIQNILNEYKIKTVPIIDKKIELKSDIEEMIKDSIGKSTLYNTQREGKVWRDIDNHISFKVINPEFLLKNNE